MPTIKIEKNELLRTCWQVFNKHGYYATSMSMLAEATGIGKSGLLHHYPSKQNLMKAVLVFSRETFEAYVLAVAKEDLPAEQRLEKMLRRQNRLSKIDRRGCFFANTALETGREELFNALITSYFDDWQKAIMYIFEPYMPKETAKEYAYQLILEYEGAVTFYKLSGDEIHLEKYVKRSVENFTKNYAHEINL